MRSTEQQSRVFYELCSTIIHILEYPLPITGPSTTSSSSSSSSSSSNLATLGLGQVSPPAFAPLFLGISLALMLFGSLTFVIGLILMPFVIGLILFFYFMGFVNGLSELGHSILYPAQFHEA